MRPATASCCVLLLCASAARASNVTVSATSGSAPSGKEFSTAVSSAGGAPVGAMEFQLTWDPAVLEFKSLEKSKALSENVLLESNLNAPGRLSVAWVAQDSIRADGPLVNAAFTVKGRPPTKSPLAIEQLRIWGPDPGHHDSMQHLVDVQAKTQPADFFVASAWPRGYLIWLGLLLLTLLFFVRRRRQTHRPRPI
jgi:hypothetical protein